MRILLVDDHLLFRAGLRLLLQKELSHAEIMEASDGREAIRLAREHPPDLCLMDLSMAGLNGIDAIPLLREVAPNARVLALSMHRDMQYVTEALRAGAQGYLVKDSAVDELVDALSALRHGRPFISQRIASELMPDLARGWGAAAESPRPDNTVQVLTARQREVLQLIAEGHSTKAMAERLFLSIKTVETHRAEIMRRLGIHDVAGLTRFAIRHGLVDPDR